MILLTHLLAGAVIGTKIKLLWVAIVLSLMSHYLLDSIPHSEYNIKNIEEKLWKKSYIDFIKVFTDFALGISIIFLLSDNSPLVYICALVALIPDGLALLSRIFKFEILKWHDHFHHDQVHKLKNKISDSGRFFAQTTIIAVLVILLF
jgi:hypothetical protein